MKKQTFIIGTRGSELSLNQTTIVKNLILKLYPHLTVQIKVVTTRGDKNMSPIPLDSVGKGWFTKELDKELLKGSIDMAVHSLKDVPEILPEGLIIAAIPERGDPREALVSSDGSSLETLKSNSVIGTDSTRRKAQLVLRRKDIVVKSVRGNVNRRLQKLDNKEYDALMLAVAGLQRLDMENRIAQYFEAADFIPSPGQGALVVVIKKTNTKLYSLLKKLNHAQTVQAVTVERAFSSAIGGGCKMPVGAYASYEGETLTLHAFVGSIDGHQFIKESMKGEIGKPLSLGKKLAKQILKSCASWYGAKRYIIITRPEDQTEDFIPAIEKLGYTPLEIPSIKIGPSDLTGEIKQTLSKLSSFDWILFTSKNAIGFFMQSLEALHIDTKILQKKRIAAVGPRSAEELKKYHLPVHFIPSTYTTEDLARELPGIEGKKILLPRSDIANASLKKNLEAKGAIVTNIPIYKTILNSEKSPTILDPNSIALITFTSPSTVDGFMKNIQSNIQKKVLGIPVLSIGPVTTKRVEHYGFKIIHTAKSHTIEGMIKKLGEFSF